MRKRIVKLGRTTLPAESDAGWLNLSGIATVEVTSEDEHFPIETVFANDGGSGWRAARSGKQVIRIILDEAVAVRPLSRGDSIDIHRLFRSTARPCAACPISFGLAAQTVIRRSGSLLPGSRW
jgi:hypothetical protein